MAAIDDLIKQIPDENLRGRIQEELKKISKQKKFGLVFEEHLPECTPLYDVPIKLGSRVAVKNGKIDNIYTVINIVDDNVHCLSADRKEASFKLNEIVCVAEFGEPIYPYLKPLATVCNAPDSSLWHTVIEAENYHALQLLEYLYAGKVDCIYIDPPYNTGARDWKYNNDYVDSSDAYRHSKWLSFMEKRLKLAKTLLNPSKGVLIVTIDEHEVHRLRMLLDEVFSEFYVQMITYVSNPTGATQGRFSRIEEYAIYCFAKDANVPPGDDPMIGENATNSEVRWKSLLRSGTGASRADRKNMFYPVYVDLKRRIVVDAGEPLPFEEKPDFSPVNGLNVAWPIRTDGSLGRWSVGFETLRKLIKKGYVQLGRFDAKRNTYGINYVSNQTQKMIDEGAISIVSHNELTGIVSLEYSDVHNQAIRTVWYRTRHNAGVYGTNLITSLLGKERHFSFPKSVYSTMDAILAIVRNNKNALILDFFAGSGTTLHAVNLLNAEDGGNRRCILVTNNEVSEAEAKELSSKGYKPGDDEWEKLGIARYVTWPRTVCSIEGHDINGEPLKGNYLGSDIPMSDGFKANAAFFKLGFLDKTSVALGRQLKELLPLLWLKAGAIGACPTMPSDNPNDNDELPEKLIFPENKFAILIEEKAFQEFETAVNDASIPTVFIVTDYDANYRAIANALHVETTYPLYRDYLDNFRINHRRS